MPWVVFGGRATAGCGLDFDKTSTQDSSAAWTMVASGLKERPIIPSRGIASCIVHLRVYKNLSQGRSPPRKRALDSESVGGGHRSSFRTHNGTNAAPKPTLVTRQNTAKAKSSSCTSGPLASIAFKAVV